MRLLRSREDGMFALVSFVDRKVPPYAILSHTWSRLPDEEVTFEDITGGAGSDKTGFQKLRFCAAQAKVHDLEYFWIDTCCIDKTNNTELAEAINSMFRWYRESERCYVYLTDVSMHASDTQISQLQWESTFRNSRWFARGWTLQELLAPRRVEFYSCDNVLLGDKTSLEGQVHQTTGIAIEALRGHEMSQFSIEERLGWIKNRETTKPEDKAYSLLGICNVFLPLIYGEGEQSAMRRLRKEIANSGDDSLQQQKLDNQDDHAASVSQHHSHHSLPFSNVPFPRDRDFVDRGDILERIKLHLSESASRVALTGLGGVGKSQLAIEYSYRVLEQSPWTWVFWIYGSTRARFEEACRAISERLGLITTGDRKSNTLDLLSRWLRDDANGPWMIIVDNADDADVFFNSTADVASDPTVTPSEAEPLGNFFPQFSKGSIVFTSRFEELAFRLTGRWSDVIRLGPMNAVEGTTLFHQKRERQDDDDAEVAELLEAVENIPLAITQAAAYINRSGPRGSVKRYLKLYRQNEQSQESLLRFDAGDLRRDNEARNSILLTWQMSFEQIARQRQSAADLLSLMSFFHWHRIPESVLRDEATNRSWPPGRDPDFEFEEDLTHLLGYGMITSLNGGDEDDMFEMHRLVRASTQMWLNATQKFQYWQEAFIRNLARNMPSGAFETWKTCRLLFPHVEAIAQVPPVGDTAQECWIEVVHRAAYYAAESGQFQAAEQLSSKILALCKNVGEGQRLLYPRSLVFMSNLQLGRGNLEAAEDLSRESLDKYTRRLGPEHIDTLSNLSNLANVLMMRGKYEDAESLYRYVIEVQGRTLGFEHHHTLRNLVELGTLFRIQGEYRDAEDLQRHVANAHQRIRGPEHTHTMTATHMLSKTLYGQGKYEEAEELVRQLLVRTERVMGPEHYRTVTCRVTLANILGLQGMFEEAEAMQRRALEVFQRTLGPDNPDTLGALCNLASIYRRQEKFEIAEGLNRRALEAYERVLGPTHRITLHALNDRASILAGQRKYEDADRLYRRVLTERERALGREHVDNFDTRHRLAILEHRRGRFVASGLHYKLALDGYTKILGREHSRTQSCLEDYQLMLEEKEQATQGNG